MVQLRPYQSYRLRRPCMNIESMLAEATEDTFSHKTIIIVLLYMLCAQNNDIVMIRYIPYMSPFPKINSPVCTSGLGAEHQSRHKEAISDAFQSVETN